MIQTTEHVVDTKGHCDIHDLTPALRRALAASGFLSSNWPVVSRVLGRAAPIFMWAPTGPGAPLTADYLALTFADSDVDLNL